MIVLEGFGWVPFFGNKQYNLYTNKYLYTCMLFLLLFFFFQKQKKISQEMQARLDSGIQNLAAKGPATQNGHIPMTS